MHAVSDLKATVAARQDAHIPGSTVYLSVALTETGIPLAHQSTASVVVSRPDGTTHTVTLHEEEPGLLAGSTPLPLPGDYPLLFDISGRTFSGAPFTRQELRTAAVWNDPQLPVGDPRDPHDRDWCHLLLCFLADDAAGRALAEHGVGVDKLRECVKKFCAEHR